MAYPSYFIIGSGNGQKAAPDMTYALIPSVRLYGSDGFPMANEPVVFSMPPVFVPGEPSGIFVNTGTHDAYYTYTDLNGYANPGFIKANNGLGAWLMAVQAVNNLPLNITMNFEIVNLGNRVPTSFSTAGVSQTKAINGVFSSSAILYDQYGSPWVGASLTVTVPAGHGTFVGGNPTTDTKTTNALGQVTFANFNSNATAASWVPVFAAPGSGIANQNGSWTTIDPAIPTEWHIAGGDNQSVAAGAAYSQRLITRVLNGLGDPLNGVAVTFTAPAAGASLTFQGTGNVSNVTTNSTGYATSAAMTANVTTGSFQVVATTAGLAPINFNLTNSTGWATEVCTPPYIDTSATQVPKGAKTWASLTQINGTTTGTTVTILVDEASYAASPFDYPVGTFDDMQDGARITKITWDYEVRVTRTGTNYPQPLMGIIRQSDQVVFAQSTRGATENVFIAGSYVVNSPGQIAQGTITGAAWKAQQWLPAIFTNAASTVAGTCSLRSSVLTVCWQNPDSSTGETTIPLQFSEA